MYFFFSPVLLIGSLVLAENFDFTGHYRMYSSTNFDEFLKVLGRIAILCFISRCFIASNL